MPLTVGSYHLWQLPTDSSPEPEEGIEFSELRNDLGNGYRSQVLYGSNTGIRSWKLKLPTLAGSSLISPAVTGINGETVSREQYVWDLFCETKVTGEPFVYQSQRNGQYYLVEFADKRLSYEKTKVQLYSTGVELQQVRVDGVSVFSPELIESPDQYTPILWLIGSNYNDGSSEWVASSSGAYVISGSGDVDKETAVQNGQDVVRLSDTTNDGFVGDVAGPLSFKEAFIVMKMREATFSNNCGVFTDSGAAGTQVLLGTSGGTKFQNPGLSATAFTYRKNGVEYAQSDLQAPMNTFGLVHVRYTTGYSLTTGFQFGKNRTSAGTFAEMDLGEIICFTSLLSVADSRELTEHLIVKWGIT